MREVRDGSGLDRRTLLLGAGTAVVARAFASPALGRGHDHKGGGDHGGGGSIPRDNISIQL